MVSIRKALFATVILGAAVIAALPVFAQSTVLDSGRGWITSTGEPNGNAASNSYFAGYQSGIYERDHFDFVIPKSYGDLSSVTLQLVESATGHVGAPTTFTVYSLGAFGTYTYAIIGTGTEYGTTNLSSGSDSTVLDISLNAAAVAAATADEGGTFSIGGVDSGDLSSGANNNYDFFSSFGTTADLQVTTAPEPGLPALLAGISAIGFVLMRRRSGNRRIKSLA